MKILQVIHGFPPHYMAGSEVYTRNICRALARNHEVHVFSRVENVFDEPYAVSTRVEDGVTVHRINKPQRDYTLEDKYLDTRIDDAFRSLMNRVRPDVVHVGHLSHLSTNIPIIARREKGVPVVFTGHDFWLHCVRGQRVRADLSQCEGPSDQACTACLRDTLKDHATLERVSAYREHMRAVIGCVDRFLVPSRTLQAFLVAQGVEPTRITYSPYGLDTSSILPRGPRRAGDRVRFGFMGRVIPVKGVGMLLEAFKEVKGPATLEVWGSCNGSLPWLLELCGRDPRVTFHGAYDHDDINSVLGTFDVLVTPSLWLENSPLVIQEALAARLPVVTSDAGGMAELITHGVNGFLVPLGDGPALAKQLQSITQEPSLLSKLHAGPAKVRSTEDDAAACTGLYRELVTPTRLPILEHRPGPWRVTFVTNPGSCNLTCAMCDTHSPHAPPRTKPLPTLPFDQVERTVKELVPRGLKEIIPSTMGEPLLYKDFGRLLDLARDTGVRVNLTTNGTFPLGGVERWAPALLPVVSDVKFSVNATTQAVAQQVMEGLDAEAQLESIRRYVEARDLYAAGGGRRSTVSLQSTLMEANLDELPRILRWAIKHGVDRLKAHHLWVTWPQLRGQSLRRTSVDAQRWNAMAAELSHIARTELLPSGRPIRLENVGPLPLGKPSEASDNTVCPFLGQEAWVEADGSFQVCCCPSNKRTAFGSFGNLQDDSLGRLWNSDTYKAFIQSWGDHPNCKECNMRQPRKDGAA